MDILSCLVGVMLFLVIYTVLELGSAAYQAEVPVFRAPPSGAEPVLVLAEGGTLRPVDVRAPLSRLLRGIEIIRREDIPVFVEQANERPVVDPWFEYSLTYDERFQEIGIPLETLALEIRERDGAVGDSLHQLDGTSPFGALLADLEPDEHWLAFRVDSSGVDVFRRARTLAVDRGFTVLWSPERIEFPFVHTLSGGSPTDLLRSRIETPQR